MAQPDLIAVSIPEADLADIKAAIATLERKLLPHLRTLSSHERIELPKMGERTVAFVQKAYEYGRQHQDLVPAYLDMAALAVDVAAVQTLHELARGLGPVADALDDSITLSGSEAYQGALVFYSNVKNAAKAKAPKAATIYDDLAKRFPGAAAAKKA